MRCRAYKTVGCPSVRPSVCLFRQFYSNIDVRLVCWWARARAAVIDRQLQAAGSVMLRAIIRGSTRTCLILLSFTNMFHIYASSSRTGVVGVSSSDTFCVREYCKRFLGSDCIIVLTCLFTCVSFSVHYYGTAWFLVTFVLVSSFHC